MTSRNTRPTSSANTTSSCASTPDTTEATSVVTHTVNTLARAVNCNFVLEDDWERYIKRMMRRGRGLITADIAQQAFEFAIYDSKVRKKELYERRMREIAAQ